MLPDPRLRFGERAGGVAGVDRTEAPAPGPVRPFHFPDVRRESLPNGVAVLTARHGNLPLVTLALVVDAGAAGEPAAAAGIARLTARALETGAAGRSADELAWELERLGVELAIQTGWDTSVVELTVPTDRLEPAFELFADIVRRPSFPPEEVERLRDEQLAEILQRRKEPGALAGDAAAHFIFARETPYARPVVGTAASVGGIGRDQVEAFYRAAYTPDRCALLLVGDVQAAAGELAARHFGDWQGAGRSAADFEVVGRTPATTVYIVDRPGAVQSEIRLGHLGVERRHEDYFPLLVMNTILGGAFTSRLNMSLREKHGFTYGVRSGFGFRRRPGPFLVQAAVATEVTARAVEEVLREMRTLCEDGATRSEVASARDYLAGVLPLELQTTAQLASRLADLVVYELPDDYFRRYRERIAAVSEEDVRRVVREHLRLDHLAIVIVGDADNIREELEQLDVGPVEVHAALDQA